MKKTKDTEYLFLSAMLRAREANMLNRERAERALLAGDAEESAKILQDCGLGDLSGLDAKGINEALSDRRAEVFEELARMSPESSIIDAFRLRYDYHNVKVALKAEAAGADAEGLYSRCGTVPYQLIVDACRNDDGRGLPKTLANAMFEAKSILSRSSNPQLSDIELDRAYYSDLAEAAKNVSGDFFSGYVKLLADTTNLRTAVRVIRMGCDKELMRLALVPGGTVDTASFPSLTAEAIASAWAGTRLARAADAAGAAISSGNAAVFEALCEAAVFEYLADAQYACFGSETLIAYLAAFERGITAARMIMSCRIAREDGEKLLGRLKYV